MKKIERAIMIEGLVASLKDSVQHYEAAQDSGTKYPLAGGSVELFDSKESIQRRICCIREQLLVLSKQMGGELP